MLVRSIGRFAAAASSGAFSSATFIQDDGAALEQLRRKNNSGGSASSSFWAAGEANSFASDRSYHHLKRPTAETYCAMSDDELTTLLRQREKQVRQLRQIYESFHYEVDQHFRKMVLDYHDKALQLSQVHGKMQEVSLQINREVLKQLRVEQERLSRDMHLMLAVCTVFTIGFWVWARRHYVARRDLGEDPDAVHRAKMAPAVTGFSRSSGNVFSASTRSARGREMTWEREERERREAAQPQQVTAPSGATEKNTSREQAFAEALENQRP